MKPIDDIRAWHLQLAVLAAAVVHALGITIYLNAMPIRPEPMPLKPPTVLTLAAPPPVQPTPPAVRQQLPAVPLAPPKATPPPAVETPTPAPSEPLPDLPHVAVPKTEEPPILEKPTPSIEPETPKPVPVEKRSPVPVPQRKPARPVAKAPPAPAVQPTPAPPPAAVTAAVAPRTIEDLTPAEKTEILTEFYVNRKENWLPVFETALHARAWLNLGFIDPTAIEEQPELYLEGLNQFMDVHGPFAGEVDPDAPLTIQEKEDILSNGFFEETGPLTVQEVDADLEKMIALGTERFIGRRVTSLKALTRRERWALIEQLYKDDPRFEVGIIDPHADPDFADMCFGGGYRHLLPVGHEVEFCEVAPLTVQEVEATLKKMLREQQQSGFGRDPAGVPPERPPDEGATETMDP